MSKTILSVSELNFATQKLLESNFPNIWVEGEISNLARPSSGHFYFSLKDSKAQIRCALFRHKSLSLTFEPRNGLLIQVQAKVSLYPDRGDYQLIVEAMELAGDGLLRKKYEALVQKLAEEGLFQEKWKKPIPSLPSHIGVITSPTGAAVRDILSVLNRRFPNIPVTLYPTKVQGSDAALDIINALQTAIQHGLSEVLILARGGGSLEDLWPFNEEILARAIFASPIPIITGIGHEVDFTIADFVSDKRAPTPSVAAEMVVPLQAALYQQFNYFEERLKNEILKKIDHQSQRVDWIFKRLRHPGETIQFQLQSLLSLKRRLFSAIEQMLKEKKSFLTMAAKTLDTLSPLATLDRGFAIVTHALQIPPKIVRSIKEVHAGDVLDVKIQDGEIRVIVD